MVHPQNFTTMNLRDLWSYHSDIASKVSSDGSSCMGPYFAYGNSPYDYGEMQLLLKEGDDEDEDEEDECTEMNTSTNLMDFGNFAHDEIGMSIVDVEDDESRYPQNERIRTNEGGRVVTHNDSNSFGHCHDHRDVSQQHERQHIHCHEHCTMLPKRSIMSRRRQRAKASAKSSSSLSLSSSWQHNMNPCNLVRLGGGRRPPEDDDDDEVLVQVVVEATAICDLDLMLQRQTSFLLDCGSLGAVVPANEEFVGGSNFVGVVPPVPPTTTGSDGMTMGTTHETRVAAIIPGGGANARYTSVPAHCLCVVPKHLDSSEICAILSTYLPAFSALHHGRSRPSRYSGTCLQGKTVLITGCTSLEAQAAVRLAGLAGASQVYVTAPREYFCVLHKHRPTILGDKVEDWLPHVHGKMDVVLDYQFPKQFSAVRAALERRKGRLICVSTGGHRMRVGVGTRTRRGEEYDARESSYDSNNNNNNHHDELVHQCCFPFEYIVEYCYLASMERATLFSFADSVQDSLDRKAKQDLQFLLNLLASRQLRPDIDRVVGLNEVAKARDDIFKRPLYGSIICQPWKE